MRIVILLLLFSGETSLHYSARCGRLEMCRLLLQWNADTEAKDK
jgi:ankyrin repeat protein